MKKILLAALLTFILVIPVNAQGTFNVDQQEITVEKGQVLELNYENAVGDIKVNFHNETDCKMFTEVYPANDGILNIEVPSNMPVQTAYLHILNGDTEKIVKVNLTEPHVHVGQLVEFIRPTETEAGRMEYFICSCGKCFEDRACTKEIEDVDTWSYIAPVPKEEWGNAPVAPVPEVDEQTVDDTKPNPTWKQEKVEEYYKQEEAEIQTELEERKEESGIETEEVIEPVALCVEPVEEEPTLWEQIKLFFINLFK